MQNVFSAGEIILITVQVWLEICLYICFPACILSPIQSVRLKFIHRGIAAIGKTEGSA